MRVKLEDVCERGSSNIKQSDIIKMSGNYPIYGASGLAGKVNFYHQEQPYVAVVKDGAGIGRTTLNPAKSSVIGTMQYLIPKKNVLPEYLFYVVSYMHLEKYYTGATIPHIYFKDYKNEEFNLDNIEKQLEIIDVLGRCKKVIEARKQELVELDSLTKARFVEMFGDPTTNPKGYPIKVLSEIAEYWNGLTYKPEDVSDEGIIVLRSSNIQNATLDFADIVRVSCKIGDKKYVQDNDILMCSRNGSARLVGKVALIKEVEEPMSFGAFMMIIRSAYYSYLMTYFQMPAFRMQIATGATTTINQITGRMLDAVKLPVPDADTINQFADFVKQVDKSKVAVQKALDETQMLFDSLMQKYFA